MRFQGTQAGRSLGAVVLAGSITTLAAAGTAMAQAECGAWSPLGLGVDGFGSITEVNDMIVYDDGTGSALYAGGRFPMAGGTQVDHVARWDGSQWAVVGSGLASSVAAFEAFDDGNGLALYAGGAFRARDGAAGDYIARWDGVSWHPLSTTVDRNIEAFEVFDDGTGPALYAGGSFSAAGGQVAYGVAKWDGSNWSPLADGIPGTIRALEVFDNGTGPALYAFGSREPYAFRWDGTQWTELPGFPHQGHDLEIYDDGDGPDLYAGGSGGVVTRLDGDTWTIIHDAVGSGTQIYALAVHDDGSGPALYAGDAMGGVSRWDGTTWTEEPVFDEDVYAFATFDGGSGSALYAGGRFTSAQGVATSRIAVRRPYCPTLTFLGGSLAAEGVLSAGGSRRSFLEFDEASETFAMVDGRRFAEGGEPGHQEALADSSAVLTVSIDQPEPGAFAVRAAGSAWVYAHTSSSIGPSEATVTMGTLNEALEENPVLVNVPQAMDLTFGGTSTGAESSVMLLDPSGQPVEEGRVEPGTYELHVFVRETIFVATGAPVADSRGTVDWTFTFGELPACRADIDGDGELTLFDFLAFQNAFDAGDPLADFDGDGELTLFDFLEFQNEFDAGCA